MSPIKQKKLQTENATDTEMERDSLQNGHQYETDDWYTSTTAVTTMLLNLSRMQSKTDKNSNTKQVTSNGGMKLMSYV